VHVAGDRHAAAPNGTPADIAIMSSMRAWDGVRGPAVLGAACAAVTTYFAVKFLLRFFETNRLTPFGIYCVVVGGTLTLAFALGL